MDWLNKIESIAVIIASGFAIAGFNLWRKQMKGRRQFEVAEKIYLAVDSAKKAINHIRHPGAFQSEYEVSEKELSDMSMPEKFSILVDNRLTRYQGIYDRLLEISTLAEIHMQVDIREEVRKLENKYRSLYDNYFLMNRYLKSQSHEPPSHDDPHLLRYKKVLQFKYKDSYDEPTKEVYDDFTK
ncbi:hypothetical protein ACFL6I_13255 [candidate division KSB1 bacterium]